MYNPFFSHSMQVFFSANGSRLVTLSRRVGSRSHSHVSAHSNTQTVVVTHRPTKTRTQTHKVPTKATRQPRRDRESVQTKLSPRRGGRTIVQIVHDQASLTRLCSSRPLSSFSLLHLPQPSSSFSSVLSKKAAIRHPPPSKNHLLVVTPFTSAGRRFCCRTTAAGSRPACSSAPNCTLS